MTSSRLSLLSPDFLPPLVCPGCRNGLDMTLNERAGSEKERAGSEAEAHAKAEIADCVSLRCRGCGAEYPISDGCPDFTLPGIDPIDDLLMEAFSSKSIDEPTDTMTGSLQNPEKSGNMADALQLGENEIILDLCGGTGDLSMWLFRMGARPWIVDFCLARVAAARHRGLHAARASALSLPFPDKAFDRIILSYTYHNWSDIRYRLRCLHEAARVLKVGGTMNILWIPNRFPKILSPGNYLSRNRIRTHVMARSPGWQPMFPMAVAEEVRSVIGDSFISSSLGSHDCGAGKFFLIRRVAPWLSWNLFDVKGIKIC